MSALAKTREQKMADREAKTRATMLKVFGMCAETLRRLYLPVGDPDRHPDADRTWAECSMQTRAALAIGKAHSENPQADVKEMFGIIIVQGRSKSAHEWEAKAIQIDELQKQRAIEAIAKTKEAP